MNFIQIHTCIRVENLERSVQFYKEALGFEETRRKDYPDDQFTLVFMTDTQSDQELELTYNYDHGSYEIGDGFSHIALETADLEAAHAFHKERGYEVTDMYGIGGKVNLYFITDPDGYDIEILQAK